MKKQLPVIALLMLALISCDSSKSVSKDLITGLTTRGDGLSCENVYLSDGEQEINRNTFIYGENIYVNFENIEGFIKNDGYAFPGMQLSVINPAGDTVMNYPDLYADYPDGINISPLLLQANVTVADPIHSESKYALYINIWDKNGEGTFKATMDFNVTPNNQIKIESNNLSYDEIFLFSRKRNITITENEANFDENIYMIFEGLSGFMEDAGKVFLGLSMKVTDSEGEILINEEDLIGDSSLELSEINQQIAPNYIIRDTSISSPVTCEIVIWDKKSDRNIKASASLNLK